MYILLNACTWLRIMEDTSCCTLFSCFKSSTNYKRICNFYKTIKTITKVASFSCWKLHLAPIIWHGFWTTSAIFYDSCFISLFWHTKRICLNGLLGIGWSCIYRCVYIYIFLCIYLMYLIFASTLSLHSMLNLCNKLYLFYCGRFGLTENEHWAKSISLTLWGNPTMETFSLDGAYVVLFRK